MTAPGLHRRGYINTTSSAGKPADIVVLPEDVAAVRCWFNSYGNPSYSYRLDNGDVLYLVDDFGAMNGLAHLQREVVARRRDLFAGWLP